MPVSSEPPYGRSIERVQVDFTQHCRRWVCWKEWPAKPIRGAILLSARSCTLTCSKSLWVFGTNGRYRRSSSDTGSSRNGRLTACGGFSRQVRVGSGRLRTLYVGHIFHSTTQLTQSVERSFALRSLMHRNWKC